MLLEKTARVHRRQVALRRGRAQREAVDAALLRRRQDVQPRAAAAVGAVGRQLLRAALRRQGQELELPRAWTCACSRRSTTTPRRRRAARAAASARPTSRSWARTRRRRCSARRRTRRRCTSGRRTTWRATTTAATSTSTRGTPSETEKNFRLFVGPKGAMKLQKMTNAVADTEGEIFTTKTGSLRYVTDRTQPADLDPGGQEDDADGRSDRGRGREVRRADQQLPAHLQRARRLPRREARQPLRRPLATSRGA